jgi:nucleotidyltransferase substrate binding protein (TIGR01987 family)
MSLLDLSALQRAIQTYSSACYAAQDMAVISTLSSALQEVIQAGIIQHFEFTYELCWKFMKRWLEKNYGSVGIDGITRRELFRLATETQLIDSIEIWMLYHQARNQTSHTYDPKIALEVYQNSIEFLPIAQRLLQRLQEKND